MRYYYLIFITEQTVAYCIVGLVMLEFGFNKAGATKDQTAGLVTYEQLTDILRNLTLLMGSIAPRGPPGPPGRRGPRGYPAPVGACCLCNEERVTFSKDQSWQKSNKAKSGLRSKKSAKVIIGNKSPGKKIPSNNKRSVQYKLKKTIKEVEGYIPVATMESVATKSNNKKKKRIVPTY